MSSNKGEGEEEAFLLVIATLIHYCKTLGNFEKVVEAPL
jgi:hypothetical protein